MIYDTDTITRDGKTYTVEWHHDADLGPPWKEHDGHGPVSGWKDVSQKMPGEVLIARDRMSVRCYDFAEATRIAKRDGWGLAPDDEAALAQRLGRAPTAKEIIREAVLSDMRRMRGWCQDEWHWCGIVVRDEHDRGASLWGIESDCRDHHRDVIDDLIGEIIAQVEADERAIISCPC